jgi:hypothetical protein
VSSSRTRRGISGIAEEVVGRAIGTGGAAAVGEQQWNSSRSSSRSSNSSSGIAVGAAVGAVLEGAVAAVVGAQE